MANGKRVDDRTMRELLREQLAGLRLRSYEELLKLVEQSEQEEIQAQGFSSVVVTRRAHLDDGTSRNLRVLVLGDNGTLKRTFFPMSGDFIIAPDGSFIDE